MAGLVGRVSNCQPIDERFESHLNFFFTFTILLYIAVNVKLLITCGVIDSLKNVLTVQCDVRVSCMIISFYLD